jgi:hypothetical protein
MWASHLCENPDHYHHALIEVLYLIEKWKPQCEKLRWSNLTEGSSVQSYKFASTQPEWKEFRNARKAKSIAQKLREAIAQRSLYSQLSTIELAQLTKHHGHTLESLVRRRKKGELSGKGEMNSKVRSTETHLTRRITFSTWKWDEGEQAMGDRSGDYGAKIFPRWRTGWLACNLTFWFKPEWILLTADKSLLGGRRC